MQIIRRGNLHKDRTFSAECPVCTCLFRFARSEATVITNNGKLCLVCPDEACKHSFTYNPKLHESQGVL